MATERGAKMPANHSQTTIRVSEMDKNGKDTGPGKIAETVVSDPQGQVHCLLFNYNFDGNMLKEQHKMYLSNTLIPFLKKHKVHVKLRGMASKQGDREYNQKLSLERVLRVKQYLTSHGIPESQVPGPELSAVGEDYSVSNNPDDEMDRAVRIIIARGTKPRPIVVYKPRIPLYRPLLEIYVPRVPQPRVPEPVIEGAVGGKWPEKSKQWRIQFVKDVSADVADASAGGAMFRLHNLENNTEVTCYMAGGGAGFGTAASMTLGSDKWTEFQTSQPKTFDDFTGEANYTTVYSGPSYLTGFLGITYKLVTGSSPGWSYLTFSDSTIAENGTVKLETGGTIGATAFSGQKGLVLCSEPRPYSETHLNELEVFYNSILQ